MSKEFEAPIINEAPINNGFIVLIMNEVPCLNPDIPHFLPQPKVVLFDPVQFDLEVRQRNLGPFVNDLPRYQRRELRLMGKNGTRSNKLCG